MCYSDEVTLFIFSGLLICVYTLSGKLWCGDDYHKNTLFAFVWDAGILRTNSFFTQRMKDVGEHAENIKTCNYNHHFLLIVLGVGEGGWKSRRYKNNIYCRYKPQHRSTPRSSVGRMHSRACGEEPETAPPSRSSKAISALLSSFMRRPAFFPILLWHTINPSGTSDRHLSPLSSRLASFPSKLWVDDRTAVWEARSVHTNAKVMCKENEQRKKKEQENWPFWWIATPK